MILIKNDEKIDEKIMQAEENPSKSNKVVSFLVPPA